LGERAWGKEETWNGLPKAGRLKSVAFTAFLLAGIALLPR